MKVDANAALGPAGRRQLSDLIEGGMTLRAAAAALSVSQSPRAGIGLRLIPSLHLPSGYREAFPRSSSRSRL